VPALAVVMTVSMIEINNRSFLPLKSALKPALFILILNNILFSLISLIPAYFFIKDPELWKGFVIIAASPAGVAIAPFTGILGGDKAFSLKGVIISHLLAILIIPIYGYLFIGVNFIQPIKLLILLSELIIAPFLISRLIIKLNAGKYILRFRGPLVNWGLFFVILTVIALNRSYIFAYPLEAGIVSIIAFFVVFGTGLLIELIFKKSKILFKNKSSLILFATVKNGGFAAAAALSLSGERASLPSALMSVVIIIYLIYLSLRASSFK
jgi:BASS family bile acid:Na+ symporter